MHLILKKSPKTTPENRNLLGLARGSVGNTTEPQSFLLRVLLKKTGKLIEQLELGYMSMKNDQGLGVTEASGTTPKTGRGCNGHLKVRFSPRMRNPKVPFLNDSDHLPNPSWYSLF